MIMTYSYTTKDGKVFGDYQCEVEDFKKFFANMHKKLANIFVKLEDRFAIWTPPTKSQYSGWQVLRKSKMKNKKWQKEFDEYYYDYYKKGRPSPEQLVLDF